MLHYQPLPKLSEPIQNKEFEFPEGCYSVFDIQNSFEYIIKKHEIPTDNPSQYTIWYIVKLL